MNKLLPYFATLVCLAILMTACGTKTPSIEEQVKGKTFVWEQEGFGGDFTIQLEEDGSYSYYVGALSSHIGFGKWEVAEDRIVMREDQQMCGYAYTFVFTVEDGNLVYVATESDEFMHVTVADGDKFLPQEQ